MLLFLQAEVVQLQVSVSGDIPLSYLGSLYVCAVKSVKLFFHCETIGAFTVYLSCIRSLHACMCRALKLGACQEFVREGEFGSHSSSCIRRREDVYVYVCPVNGHRRHMLHLQASVSPACILRVQKFRMFNGLLSSFLPAASALQLQSNRLIIFRDL